MCIRDRIYILFLAIMGLPIVAMEFAVGRASQKSAALSFDILEPKGSKWHIEKYFAMAGNYVLMMFYTTVAGWMICYFFKMLMGDFAGLNADQVAEMCIRDRSKLQKGAEPPAGVTIYRVPLKNGKTETN